MKVYVDELPKSCNKCPYCRTQYYFNTDLSKHKLGNECLLGSVDKCKLQLLEEYTKKVKSEMAETILKRLLNVNNPKDKQTTEEILINVLTLEKILKEEVEK